MRHAESPGIRTVEIIEERTTESIGDLERRAKQHREDEEHGYLLTPEQHKGVESKCRDQAAGSTLFRGWALGHRECVRTEEERGARTDVQLERGSAPADKIHRPHGGSESDGTPDANRRKCLDDVQTTLPQNFVRHGVVERDGWHVD